VVTVTVPRAKQRFQRYRQEIAGNKPYYRQGQ
jgi:hypothetical protein